MKKRILSCFMAVMLLAGFTPIRAMAEDLHENGKFIYVRNDGDDSNTGTDESEPYLTLAKAVTAAESGDTIIVLSDLEMEACARFYDKEITIKSGDDGPYTVTRGENFAAQSDPARQEYNPAMIEVNGTEILDNDGIGTGEFNKSALRLENIILDDNGITEGSYFEYASTDTTGKLASGRFNYELVQDAVVATYNGVGTITLGEGTEIKNFGGMTAVFITGDGCLVMESGSRIYDDTTLFTIEKPAPTGMVRREKQSLSAVHFVSGGKLDMQEGSEIKNLRNACAFNLDGTDADKGDIVINGEITGIENNLGNTPSVRLGTSGEVVLGPEGRIADNECTFISGIYARQGSTIHVYGEISGNNTTKERGGGIYLIEGSGKLSYGYIYDGAVIANNSSSETGSGIMVNNGAILTMYGGEISGNHADIDGGGVEVRRDGVFIMNGGVIKDNTAAEYGNGICIDANTKPAQAGRFEFNGGEVKNNNIVIRSKGYGHTDGSNGYVYISEDAERDDTSKGIVFENNSKTITPDGSSLDIKLGNALKEAVDALKTESTSKGWSDSPLGSFWLHRDGGTTLEISGLSPAAGLPIYLLVTETDESGKPAGTGVDIYYVEDESGTITVTLPDKGYENGCAAAFFQPINDNGNVVITTTVPVLMEEEDASNYDIPYKAQYTMSQSLLTQLKTIAAASAGTGTGIELKFVIELDNRLTAKKDALGDFIYNFDGAGVVEEKPEEISVSPDGHTIEVPCKLTDDWKTNIAPASDLVMNLYGTGVLGAADFKDGEIINTTGYIEIKLPILGNILIPANICKTNMEGLIRYTVTHESGEGSGDDHIEFHIAGKSFEAKSIDDLDFMAPPKKVFNGWKWHEVKGADRIELKNKPNTITGNLAAVAQWKKESGGVTAKYYTLKYETNGGTEYKSEDYPEGTKTVLGKVPVKEGYVFTGWYDSEDLDNKISSIDMDSNKTVYAGWKKRTDDTEHNNVDVSAELNVEEHTAYIVGSNDGLIHPNDKITRAEAATIFFRLLKDDIRNKNYIKTNRFNDVYIDNWYNTAISTVANAGIISGYPDGSFRPNAPITRAEFAAICARFDPRETTATTLFADVKGHWAEKEIIRAAENGWVSGYTDGTFKPDVNITRAEAMSLINRVLKRNPETVSDLHGNMLIWADNTDTGKWYYIDVQEATNSHDYIRKENGTESWTEVLKAPDWARLER